MSQALALIAHDLKNALGSLEAELGQLRARAADAPTLTAGTQLAQATQQAHEHCQALREQFVQFLTLYGAQQGELRALCEDEAPQQLLEALAEGWRKRLAQEGRALSIAVETDPALPPCWYLDRRLLRLALDAAIHNATRFARHHVRLSATCDGPWLALHVDDDGPGLDHGPTDATHSTGLGRALGQAVAQAHVLGNRQGCSELVTRAEGGARFSMRLP